MENLVAIGVLVFICVWIYVIYEFKTVNQDPSKKLKKPQIVVDNGLCLCVDCYNPVENSKDQFCEDCCLDAEKTNTEIKSKTE